MTSLGRPRLHLRETDSTNERARALAARGAVHGTLVTAAAQTAGRGRLGRTWLAPTGTSVLASLVLRDLGERAELVPLVAALAVSEGCERCAPVGCAIKWPNDVWVDRRKVAGILLEGRPQEGWLVLGIGVNVSTREEDFPPELRATATSLAAAAAGEGTGLRPPESELTPDAVLATVLERLEARLAEAPSATIGAWSERDALRGGRVRWDSGEGVARGIDASGALVVDLEGGARERLRSGEVSLVRPADG